MPRRKPVAIAPTFDVGYDHTCELILEPPVGERFMPSAQYVIPLVMFCPGKGKRHVVYAQRVGG